MFPELNLGEIAYMSISLSVKGLQHFAGISAYMAYKIMRHPDSPSYKVGRKYYINSSELTNWLRILKIIDTL